MRMRILSVTINLNSNNNMLAAAESKSLTVIKAGLHDDYEKQMCKIFLSSVRHVD